MKKHLVRILCSTAVTLLVLSLIGTLYGAKFLRISSVFESFAANIVIHLGFMLTSRFESKYIALDSAIDIGYTVIVLIAFGYVFDWFGSTPIWILVIMAIVIYAIGLILSLFRIRSDVKSINELLKKRKQFGSQ